MKTSGTGLANFYLTLWAIKTSQQREKRTNQDRWMISMSMTITVNRKTTNSSFIFFSFWLTFGHLGKWSIDEKDEQNTNERFSHLQIDVSNENWCTVKTINLFAIESSDSRKSVRTTWRIYTEHLSDFNIYPSRRQFTFRLDGIDKSLISRQFCVNGNSTDPYSVSPWVASNFDIWSKVREIFSDSRFYSITGREYLTGKSILKDRNLDCSCVLLWKQGESALQLSIFRMFLSRRASCCRACCFPLFDTATDKYHRRFMRIE